MDRQLFCSHCGQDVLLGEPIDGTMVQCPNCGGKIVLTPQLQNRLLTSNTPLVESGSKVGETKSRLDALRYGWILFAGGVVVGLIPFPTWYIYIPMFLTSSVLSIFALTQKRLASGVTLLLANLIVGSLIWAIGFTVSADKAIDTALNTARAGFGGKVKEESKSMESRYPELDAKNGFQEFIFGTGPSQYANIERQQNFTSSPTDDEQKYDVSGSHRFFGGIWINWIYLSFDTGLLSEIRMEVEGRQNVAGLREALTQAYGKPEGHSDLNWEGNRVSLWFNQVSDDLAWVSFKSKEIEAKIRADIDRKAKERAVHAAEEL